MPRAHAKGEKRSTFRGERVPVSPTSREAAALEKASTVSSWSEGHGAMIQTARKRIGGTNAEFEPGTSSYDEDEHPNLTRVQLRSAKPFKQQALMPNTNGYHDCELWLYKDKLGTQHGPFSGALMASWFASGCFRMSLPVKRTCDREFQLLGQLIKTWGRLPFRHQTSPDQPNCSADERPVTAGATPAALPSDCGPAKEKPPLGCDDKFLKDSQISFVGLQEKSRAMITIKALPMAAASHPAGPPAALVRSAERVKVPLGFCDAAELPAEDKRTKGGTKKVANQHEGAWGGYKKCQSAARSFVPPAVTQPAETKTAANRRSTAATAATTAAPMTWAKVCLKVPTKPRWGEPAKQEPVAIENMARFPSLGGKAFTDAVQNKMKNQRQNQQQIQQYEWARRMAADQDFTRWSYDRLRNLPSYVHVPTFFELLRDVDSSAEIEEYVRMHLGNGEEVSRFAQEFVQRRSEWKQLTGWKSPAELRAATGGVDMVSKGRKKMQKLNGTALGFVMAGEAFKKV